MQAGRIVIVILLVILALFGTYFGFQYGLRFFQTSNTSSLPKQTILIDQTVTLTEQFLGGGYSWKLTLSSGESLTIDVQSSNTVFVNLQEDRINSPLSLRCNSNPVYLLPQTLIHDSTGTTNGHWTVTSPEDCGYTLSVEPPMATYYTMGQTITAHVIVKQIP